MTSGTAADTYARIDSIEDHRRLRSDTRDIDHDEAMNALVADEEQQSHQVSVSFLPVDLSGYLDGTEQQPLPTMLIRRNNDYESALIYPGVVNGFHGDSGIGKSWLALLLLSERMTTGETVMLLDLEDTPGSVIGRLLLLGVRPQTIADRLVYVRPADVFGPVEVEHLAAVIDERSVTVVVLDSIGEAFGLEGINEDSDREVGPWLRGVARRLADTGAAVVLIDHSTKANGNKLHPSGSKRKRAAMGGASYLIEAETTFVKGEGGRLRVTCAKDRHGNYRRDQVVAWLNMTCLPGGTITLELLAPAAPDNGGPISDQTEEAVIDLIRAEGQISKNRIQSLCHEANLRVGKSRLSEMLDLLVRSGTLTEAPGSRGARMFAVTGAERRTTGEGV